MIFQKTSDFMDLILVLSLFALAFILGIKHSFDADHLVAVSGLLTKSPSLKKTSLLSLTWAVGHMITATVLTIVLFTFKDTLFKEFFSNFDILVPIMLIFIALVTLAFEFDIIHRHKHTHSHPDTVIEKEHTHVHTHILGSTKKDHGAMIGIGFIHGIASNDELLVLFTFTFALEDLGTILIGVFIFSIGVIIGMIAYGLSVNYPMQKWGTKKVSRVVNVTIAGLSLIYAGWLLAGLNGINLFELL